VKPNANVEFDVGASGFKVLHRFGELGMGRGTVRFWQVHAPVLRLWYSL